MADVAKKSKKEYFGEIKGILEAAGGNDEYVEFLDTQIEQLTAQAEKAAARRLQKAKESDEVRATVLAQVTTEPQTAAEITEAIGDEEITKNKVVARLTQLVKTGEVVKQDAKIEGVKGKTSVYTLA